MYSFEAFSTFTLMRPVFITFLLLSVMLFIVVVLPIQRKWLTSFTISSISIVSIVACAQMLYIEGIIVDELNLGGDIVSTFMFLAITLLSLLNPIIYFVRQGKRGGKSA